MQLIQGIARAASGRRDSALGGRDVSSRQRRQRLLQYLLPVAGVAFASLVMVVGRSALPENTPYLLFFIPVALAAGAGGLLPGIAATILSALACDLLLVRPLYAFEPQNWLQLPLALFILISLLVSAFSELLLLSHRRAEAARRDAVIAHQRIAFLAEASLVLDKTLDHSRTVAALTRMVVPLLADWCAIELVEEDSDQVLLASAHQEPDKEPLIAALQGRYPFDAQGANPVQRVLATGEPVICVDIPDSSLVESARDAEHLRIMRELQIRSFLAVPLKARGRTVGAMMFVSAAKRRYTPEDVTLARDLARRAALAVDNARLYETIQNELRERERTQAALVKSREHTAELNERLKRSVTETHHRVKNNLQVIAAMVDMMVMEDDAYVPKEELLRLASHIKTLAAVHDILTHQTKSEGRTEAVSVRAVLDRLLALMRESTPGRNLRYQIDDARLPAKQSTSLALLVNELVSNAVKHGNGEVELCLTNSGSTATLEVCDDGPGFPEDFDPRRAANTGLDLVDSLSRWDLSGEVEFLNRPKGGARVVVRFPVSQFLEPAPAGTAAAA